MNNLLAKQKSNKRRWQLSLTMGVIVLIVSISTLLDIGYQTYKIKKSDLLDKVSGQKQMIEAVGRFDTKHSNDAHQDGSVAATLTQVVDAFIKIDHKKSNELVLAEHRGDKIVFIASRFSFVGKGHNVTASRYHLPVSEHSTDYTSKAAEPMRRAFNGQTGTVMGQDYRQTYVLAAHTPVTIGGKQFGLVAKIDLADFITPLGQSYIFALLLAIILIGIGANRFLQLINPIIKELETEVAANQAIFDTSPSGIVTIDKNGTIKLFNKTAEKLFLYSPNEAIGKNIADLIPALSGKIAVTSREVTAKQKSNLPFPIHLAMGEMNINTDDDDDDEIQFIGIITDISDRKMAEKQLLQKDRAVEESPVGVIITDTDGKINYVNPASLSIHGYDKPEEILGNTPKIFRSGKTSSKIYEAMWRHLKANKPWKGELLNRKKDGSLVWVRQHLTPIRLEDGTVDNYVSIQEDVTEIRAYRENLEETVRKRTVELEEARDAAEAATKSKSMFLANMSHEIRTPMNAIIGFSDLLMQTKLSSEQCRHLSTVSRSARALLTLLNDILDIAKLEEGQVRLENIAFSLRQLLEDVISTMSVKSDQKGLALNFNIADGLPPYLSGDPTRLRQILMNLLGNGIKFTSKGTVSIEVKSEKEDFLHFLVIDSGIGIPADRIDTIFEAFSQADVSTTRKHGGTGLGTTISKQFVELMGGNIWAESIEGEGSTFHFTAMLPEADEADMPSSSHKAEENITDGRNLSILIAEDVPENVELVTLRLLRAGHEVTHGKNGAEAVRLFQEQGPFDVILMDIQMPVMDGEEATKKIRTLEKENGANPTPIIALTASIMYEERERYLSSGMNSIVGKPIDFVELFTMISSVVPKAESLLHEGLADVADSASIFPELIGVDTEKGLATWHDKNVYRKNLISFAQYHGKDVTLLKEAVEKNDLDKAKRIIHALKGVAGNLALTSVNRVAEEINGFAEAEWSNSKSLLNNLEKALDEVVLSISKLTTDDQHEEAEVIPLNITNLTKKAKTLTAQLIAGSPDDEMVADVIAHMNGHINKNLMNKITDHVDNFDFDDAAKEIEEALRLLQPEGEK